MPQEQAKAGSHTIAHGLINPSLPDYIMDSIREATNNITRLTDVSIAIIKHKKSPRLVGVA